MKKEIIYRAIFLLSVPILTCGLFWMFGKITQQSKLSLLSENNSDQLITEEEDEIASEIFNFLPYPIGLSLFLVNVDVYARNEVRLVEENSTIKPTLLNVNIAGRYVGGIASGEEKMVYKNVNFLKLFKGKVTRSFSVENTDMTVTPDSFYRISIIPNISAYVFIFFMSLILWFSVISFFNKMVEFVRGKKQYTS